MLRPIAATLLLVPLVCAPTFAQTCTAIPVDTTDGVVVAPDNHNVIYEDQDVRVLAVVNLPHTTEAMHTHARASLFLVLEEPGGLVLPPFSR